MPIPADLYKKIGRSAAGPVCIVAAFDRTTDAIVGLTASSFVIGRARGWQSIKVFAA